MTIKLKNAYKNIIKKDVEVGGQSKKDKNLSSDI